MSQVKAFDMTDHIRPLCLCDPSPAVYGSRLSVWSVRYFCISLSRVMTFDSRRGLRVMSSTLVAPAAPVMSLWVDYCYHVP